MRAALLLLPLASSVACLRQIEFQCSLNSQCSPGTCQTAVGYCSFSDSACPSGQRFGDLAGPYAGLCVGELPTPPIDGSPADGAFSPCPADYAPLGGGSPGHVYRKAPQNVDWLQQDNFCRTTSARAYLAVPDDATELVNLHMLAAGAFWVGINDRVTEGTFAKVTGGAATFLPWATGQPDNGGGGQGEDCVAATATTISDEECSGAGAANRPAVCECNP